MTIRSYLEKFAQETPQATALRYFEAKDWHARSWADFLAGVRAVAEAYGPHFALRPRAENVALMLPNGPEWMEAYLACSGAGVGVVPLDPKLHSAEVEYILKDSGAVVVTTDKAHLDLMRLIAPNLPDLRAVVLVDAGEVGPDALGDVPLFDYVALKSDPETVRRAAGHEAWYGTHVAQEEDVASIIYTSGTTGKPKGAMLTHANFIADIEGALRAFDDMTVDGNDTLLVVLPLFHAFSFCTNFVLGLFRGCQMAFVRSLYTIGEDIRVLQPTIVMSVPLLAEKMFDRIDAKIKASKKARFLMAVGLGGLVRYNVRKGLGGRLRFMIVGGAPCPKHVLEGFRRLALPVLEGYGLTECSPVVSIAGPKVAKIGTIGLKLANIEIRLADQNEQGVGELQVKGPITMKGYWHNEAATAEAFDGDWLKTGDLASIDEIGLISIRGRKKALIVNREGKNIYPEEVEAVVNNQDYVVESVVVDRASKLVALVYLDHDAIRKAGLDDETIADIPENIRINANKALPSYSQLQKVEVMDKPFEKTPKMSIKRFMYK